MFIRTSFLAMASVLAIPMLAVASPAPVALTEPTGCSTGTTTHCCESLHKPGDKLDLVGLLSGLLNVVIPANVPIGLGCSPISVLGGGNQCTHQTVCCTSNTFNGLIGIGCTPIVINL